MLTGLASFWRMILMMLSSFMMSAYSLRRIQCDVIMAGAKEEDSEAAQGGTSKRMNG